MNTYADPFVPQRLITATMPESSRVLLLNGLLNVICIRYHTWNSVDLIQVNIIRDVTTTAVLCIWVINNLESGSDQFLYIIHHRSSQKLERDTINYHSNAVLFKYSNQRG